MRLSQLNASPIMQTHGKLIEKMSLVDAPFPFVYNYRENIRQILSRDIQYSVYQEIYWQRHDFCN